MFLSTPESQEMSRCPLHPKTAVPGPCVALPGARGSSIFGQEGFVSSLRAGRSLPRAGPAVISPIHQEQGQESSGSAIPWLCSFGGVPLENSPVLAPSTSTGPVANPEL